MSAYEEKKQGKIDRYEELAEKNREAGEALLENTRNERNQIPFGQPILVGHHSEKRHRNHLNRMNNRDDKGFELLKKAEYYERKAKSAENSNSISSDDPEAVQKLKEKLANLEDQREAIKKYNKEAKKNGKEKTPSYVLTNLGANIRSVKKRIEKLKELSKQETSEETIGDTKIVKNVEENRVQILFPSKPSKETRAKLKRSGFRWAPSEGAWQRQISWQAEHLAKSIVEEVSND